MDIPVQITFKNMQSSQAIEKLVHRLARKLEFFGKLITTCHVFIEAPHRHHRNGHRFNVRIHIAAPNGSIDVRRAPKLIVPAPLSTGKDLQAQTHVVGRVAAHVDIQAAIRDAFDAARRRLQSYVANRRGEVKVHQRRAAAPGS